MTIEFTESSHSVYPWDEWWDSGLIEGLKAHDIKPVVSDNRIEPIYGPLGWLNVLVPAMPGIAGALGAVLGAWLTQHGGRKLKLKVGDREFEARTAAELEVLLKLSQGIQTADGTKNEKATIGAIAHELWIARGRPEGSPEVDWFQAENLLRITKKG